MNCLSSALIWLGVYEHELEFEEAERRLAQAEGEWLSFQTDRKKAWADWHEGGITSREPVVHETICTLYKRGVEKGVAVILGCGVNRTTFDLLDRGWRVYALDSSQYVLEALKNKCQKWLQNGQLSVVESRIEEYEFPKNVQLIIASHALPYAAPTKIAQLFDRAQKALFSPGVFVSNFFPKVSPAKTRVLQTTFGSWFTTKNVISAIVKRSNFPDWSVQERSSHVDNAPLIYCHCWK